MKKRSILISMLVIGVVAALIAAATTATFSDQVTTGTNTFTAGTLYMSVNNQCDRAGTTGGTGNWAGSVGNYGTDATAVAGGPDANANPACQADANTLSFTLGSGNTSNASCTNMAPGDSCSTTYTVKNKGSLDGTLSVVPTITSSTGCAASNWTITVAGSSASTGTSIAIGSLTAGSSTTAAQSKVQVTLNTSAGNPCQGASATVALAFHLVQA
ncbi:MAG TPA: SipW-dependent-type signal peptide-containing protein [Tepidiformaceae bacterium]|nr:SipW-dependent-type signal peptide-containing protein [Tepidiformaceae bacterium]